jgi:hypothetical protein
LVHSLLKLNFEKELIEELNLDEEQFGVHTLAATSFRKFDESKTEE